MPPERMRRDEHEGHEDIRHEELRRLDAHTVVESVKLSHPHCQQHPGGRSAQ